MYLTLIFLPLMALILSGFFGRKVGVTGSQLITCSCVLITTILIYSYNTTPVTIKLFRWIDLESLNVLCTFNFDYFMLSMLMLILSHAIVLSVGFPLIPSIPTKPTFEEILEILEAFGELLGPLVWIYIYNYLMWLLMLSLLADIIKWFFNLKKSRSTNIKVGLVRFGFTRLIRPSDGLVTCIPKDLIIDANDTSGIHIRMIFNQLNNYMSTAAFLPLYYFFYDTYLGRIISTVFRRLIGTDMPYTSFLPHGDYDFIVNIINILRINMKGVVCLAYTHETVNGRLGRWVHINWFVLLRLWANNVSILTYFGEDVLIRRNRFRYEMFVPLIPGADCVTDFSRIRDIRLLDLLMRTRFLYPYV